MSISVTKIVNLPQAALKFLVQNEIGDDPVTDYKTIGGVFSDTDYAWLSSGPRLEVLHTKSGTKVGAWTFGWVLRDSNTQVICVDEIKRPHGRAPLLAVGIDCDFSGGMICIFDFITSKIIRAIQIKEKVTNLHVIDSGYDIFTLPGPLRNFDGVIAVGTAGGDVFLIDICRQICDEALTTGGLNEIRDELNPSQLSNITIRDLSKIEFHKEFAIRNSNHLAVHMNIVFDKSTKHFTLKGPKGEDRIHVNKDEVAVSALFYCPQLGSLLVGYNFGALQLYNLMNLELVYTSPVCDEHIPISHFAIQEPADDPRAVCYVWAVYSAVEQYPTCLPLAVMYAFCYHTKEYHEGHGYLYQDFSSAAVQYQMELGVFESQKRMSKLSGGNCLKLKSINQGALNREGPQSDSNEDNVTLCVFVWNVWYSKKETNTFVAIFDLNQWYKEQMPNVFNAQYCSTYLMQLHLDDLIKSATQKSLPILDVHTDGNSLQQFTGAQRLEEHFYPNSLTFGMTCLCESDIVLIHNCGVQKALLAQIESSGPLCLVEPADIYQQVIGLGLVPLFIDLPVNAPITTNQQREVILGTALENQLMGWLCKCASEWANGSFLSTGCSLDFLISWAFQRAIALKTNCDKFCEILFDYSQVRLDNNTNILLNSCTRQLRNLYSLYAFVINKLSKFISNRELVMEQYKSLETVSVYFEVLQWLLNVGLLPECPLTSYPRSDDLERINAPYPAEMLTDFYNHRRAVLRTNEENLSTSENVLFVDNLIERECGGKILQEQWRNDGGNGLYPPPSLQALLRTYLIDNVDLSYKHSVIIYVFLDLAMTLDQDRYKPVITHLIKFPAVFKVSPSVIKITQAFWQLDHSDFNTAMGLLLDPLIATEDLNPWHHRVVLKALMLQKQYNFALLYIQVRKPVLSDDEDILSAISLYVANNMIDEAFYFEKNCNNQRQKNKFLTHLLDECKKSNKLRYFLYRSLALDDENFFLKYLTNSREPAADDLLVYYHLLRAHYIEAFESHERTLPNQIENQGLEGQENASLRERIVHTMKKLLPDVSRSLISVCHKEKSNLWQEVTRPTPLSVFVHNLNENVQYKSTLIGAALSKARQTFNETFSEKSKMETEGTPFLRTPTISVVSKRASTVLVNPKVVDDVDQMMGDHTPPPVKRLKLSPRANTSLPTSIPSKLDTPLVRRKTPKAGDSTETEAQKVATPHSILKVKRLVKQTPSKKYGQFEDDFKEFEKLEYTPVTSMPKKSGLGLSPRKSLTKPSPVVRFEGFKSSSSSSLNVSRNLSDKLMDSSSINVSSVKLATPSGSNSKNSSSEEVFYSPDASLEDKQVADDNKLELLNKALVKEIDKVSEERLATTDLEETEVREEISEEKQPSPVFSPKARRSYKRSLGEKTPTRFSPRLSRNSTLSQESISSPQKVHIQGSSTSNSDGDNSKKNSVSAGVSEHKPLLPKLCPRKSLCRTVLESNTIKVLNSPLESPRSRRSAKIDTPKVTNTEETTEKTVLKCTSKYEDGEETHKTSFIKRQNLTMSLVESDLDTSEEYHVEYDKDGELKLSESMLKYINSSNKSIFGNISTLSESSLVKEIDNENDHKNYETHKDTDKEVISENTSQFIEKEIAETNAESGQNLPVKISDLGEKSALRAEDLDDSLNRNKETVFESSVDMEHNKSMAYSVFDSSAEMLSMSYDVNGPKLSESIMRCIDDHQFEEFEEQKAKQVQNEETEVMEVDEDVEMIEENQTEQSPAEKSDELLYVSSNLIEGGKVQDNKEKGHEESFDENNRPVDPEMNVFEVSDDLSFNDGLIIEKEVTLEEDDLCFDQQNTLESVLQENIRSVASTPINAFEKNVFNESLEEESSDEESQPEPYLEPEVKEEKNSEQILPNQENEIIEIGSSSEEDDIKSEEESSHSSEQNSSEYCEYPGPLDVSYETHIYGSENDYGSESSCERPYSEISENSDDDKYNQTTEKCGLFQGDILFIDEKEEESNDAESSRSLSDAEDNEIEENVEQTDDNLKHDTDHDKLSKEEDEVMDLKGIDDDQIEENVEQTDGNREHGTDNDVTKDQSKLPEEEDNEMMDLNHTDHNQIEENVDENLERHTSHDVTENQSKLPEEEENEVMDLKHADEKQIEENVEQTDEDLKHDAVHEVTEDLSKHPEEEHNEVKNLKQVDDSIEEMDEKSCKSSDGNPEDIIQEVTESINKPIADQDSEGKEKEEMKQAETIIREDGTKTDLDLNEDVSVEMEELNYSVQHEEADSEKQEELRKEEEKMETGEKEDIVATLKVADERPIKEEEQNVLEDSNNLKCEVSTNDGQIRKESDLTTCLEKGDIQMAESEEVVQEKISSQDLLDVDLVTSRLKQSEAELDFIPKLVQDSELDLDRRPTTSSVSEKSTRKSRKNTGAVPAQRRITRRVSQELDMLCLDMGTPKREPDVLEHLVNTPLPLRNLRSRRVSTDSPSTPTVTLRKRSASVDEMKPSVEEQLKNKTEIKPRNQRASSVVHLPKIPEEDGVSQKKSKSVLESYSMNRRVTRRQLNLLQKVEDVKQGHIPSLDPIVLLDKITFEGKPDPEEEKVYESSPSSTNSTSSSPVKTSRRLRSASQASDTSQRSKSTTPVGTSVGRPRKASTDEASNKSTRNASRKKLETTIKQDVNSEPRTTRSRTKSVSSVNSEESSVSETPKAGRRRRRVTSQSILPEIKEESSVKSDVPTIPKKRTRKNSSQI